MIRCLLIVLIVIFCCGVNKPDDLRLAIKKFDAENGDKIRNICDSLIKIIGNNRSYAMVVFPSNEAKRFREVDSTRQLSEYFIPGFVPSNSQMTLLAKAGANVLYYDKKKEIFFAKLHYYKSSDKTITLYLYFGSKKLSPKKIPFFEEGNRKYILDKN